MSFALEQPQGCTGASLVTRYATTLNRYVPPCAAKPCAVRPVFCMGGRELGAADPRICSKGHATSARPGAHSEAPG